MYIYHLRLNTIIVFFCISILFTNVFFTGSSLDNSDVYLSSSSNSRGSPRSPYIIDLNTTTAYPHQNITIYGLDSEDNAGYSVASGDVNNDGRDDIIIGAYHANGPGDTKIDCGKVYVLFSDNTLNGTISASQADMIIYGAESGDSIGDSITTGDVNGDTIDDIVIGATLADGLGNGRANSGEVYVIFGSNSLPAVKNLAISPPDVLIYGAESGDFSGKSVVTGDINGDNIHDIIIGAIYADGPSETRSNCGEVYLIYGNTVLPSNIDLASQADVTIYGVDAGDLAGHSVSAGDVNNNGYGDIIIGAIWARGPGNMRMFGGEAYLVYGNGSMLSTIDLATQANMTIYGKSQPSFGGCLGSSVASGDVNGDNIDDIIIGAQSEGILVSYMIAGAVHIIYGSTSLPIIQDLQMLKSNVTINGSCFYGYSGWAVAAGDINGDLIDDIIISSYRADKPLNGRSQCGEVHVINGSSSLPSQIDLIESEEDILVYGAESDDQVGISLAVGTIDSDNKYDIIIGAPYADGVNNIVTNCGEVYLILSAGEVFPTLKTEFIGLINGDGINNTTCYAKYKPYTFRVKVKVSRGLSALKTVNLGLDYHNNNLQYKWSEYGRNFTEVSDPNDYAFLNSMSTFRNNSKDTWTIDFNITFNWSYPDNDFHSIEVHSTSDSGLYDWLNLTDDIYRVENHLDFNGTLIAIGNYQGTLTEEDWVRGGEQINWSGLKVVYDGTNATYPPKGSGVNVTVWDSDGDYWNENPNSGENISITSPAAIKTNLNEIFILNITGVPSTCDNSSVTFKLNIDADNVSFANSFPNKQQWNTMLNPQCGITILDPTTKVNASSIQYQISTDNGTTWESDWINFETQQEDAESINCIVRPIFKDGKDNLIKWRAKDILGNGYTESEKFRILIDISNVTYSNITPSSEEWQTNLSVVCNITIIDNLSGVDASSIEFRISTDGIYNYGIWQSARKAINRNIIHCSVSPKFKEGIENYIQWRAKDIVGNGPFVSEDYQIKIKINYPPEVILLSPSDSIIIKTLTPELVWKGTDPDEDTSIYYYVYLNTDENKIINLDKSALLVSNFIDPKYKLESPLEDGFTYYWTVIPNDGIINGICSSGIWHFKIDTTVEIPIVTLVSPINNSNVSTQTPSLTWNVNYSNKKIVSYNVFIDLFSSLDNFTADHELPSFMPSQPLIRGASY
ncbi:MAG: FG-GAP repeat protein, partial [Thermoplasmata archaeon]|nr:FG-GAP repeat protein [Thermoplasmata archaeon]